MATFSRYHVGKIVLSQGASAESGLTFNVPGPQCKLEETVLTEFLRVQCDNGGKAEEGASESHMRNDKAATATLAKPNALCNEQTRAFFYS